MLRHESIEVKKEFRAFVEEVKINRERRIRRIEEVVRLKIKKAQERISKYYAQWAEEKDIWYMDHMTKEVKREVEMASFYWINNKYDPMYPKEFLESLKESMDEDMRKKVDSLEGDIKIEFLLQIGEWNNWEMRKFITCILTISSISYLVSILNLWMVNTSKIIGEHGLEIIHVLHYSQR